LAVGAKDIHCGLFDPLSFITVGKTIFTPEGQYPTGEVRANVRTALAARLADEPIFDVG